MSSTRTLFLVLAALTLGVAAAFAQRDWSKVEIKTTPVADGIWMLQGAGGNIGVFAGADGAVLIDDQYAPLSDKIKAAVATLTDRPIRFVLNTHWHGDHVGGNEAFAAGGATVVAHANARRRMSRDEFSTVFQAPVPASPEKALPVVTFGDSLRVHLNGEEVTLIHMPPAHTDGDAIVWFPRANVIHAGDCLFSGSYPVIDVSAGGSVEGMIGAANQILALAREDTKIIPGHGPLATRDDLRKFRDMLVVSRDRVKKLIAQKQTLDQIQKAKPLAELDSLWGTGFINPNFYLRELHLDLSRK